MVWEVWFEFHLNFKLIDAWLNLTWRGHRVCYGECCLNGESKKRMSLLKWVNFKVFPTCLKMHGEFAELFRNLVVDIVLPLLPLILTEMSDCKAAVFKFPCHALFPVFGSVCETIQIRFVLHILPATLSLCGAFGGVVIKDERRCLSPVKSMKIMMMISLTTTSIISS